MDYIIRVLQRGMLKMGKLSDLWASLKTCKEEEREGIQKQINSTEQWCIDKGFAGIKEITDWTKFKPKKTYRFEAGRCGEFQIPDGALTGKDMCGCCRYNKRYYCDPKDLYAHTANV